MRICLVKELKFFEYNFETVILTMTLNIKTYGLLTMIKQIGKPSKCLYKSLKSIFSNESIIQ